ncbi:hypothetical protein IT575_13280 [bacterium]|nr:hypothetical protein [bacterium]
MPLSDALESWWERQHPKWLQRWWPALLLAALLLLASLLIAFVNTAETLASEPEAGRLMKLLSALRGRRWLDLALGMELAGVLLLLAALIERRRLLAPPQDLRVALSPASYRSYARACLDAVEESLLLWALPVLGLLSHGTAWLMHFVRGGFHLGTIGLPALASILFKFLLAQLCMYLLLRPQPSLVSLVTVAGTYLLWWLLRFVLGMLAANGTLNFGLPAVYSASIVELLLLGGAIAILAPILTQRRYTIQASFGKLD